MGSQSAKDLGYTYEKCVGATPDAVTQCATNAINAKPAVIVINGAGVEGNAADYARIADAGIPIVGSFTGNPAGVKGVSTELIDRTFRTSLGKSMAQGIIADSNGKADTVFFQDDAFTCDKLLRDGFKSAMSDCDSCKVKYVSFSINTMQTTLPQQALAEIQANPSLGYMAGTFDAVATFASDAVRQSGRTNIKVAGEYGFAPNREAVRSGSQFLDFMQGQYEWGWAAADAAARIFSGTDVPDSIGLTTVFYTKKTAKVLGENGVIANLAISGIVALGLLIPLAAGVFDVSISGTSSVLLGLSAWISGGQSLSHDIPSGFLTLGRTQIGRLPITVIYTIAIGLVIWCISRFTPVGRRIYTTGANREAARLSGVRTSRIIVAAFMASALLAAVAGIVYAARLGAGPPNVGAPYLLPAFSAVFLGSTIIEPGRFNVPGLLIAMLIVGVGINGLQLSGISFWIVDLFQGAVLIIAVVLAGRVFDLGLPFDENGPQSGGNRFNPIHRMSVLPDDDRHEGNAIWTDDIVIMPLQCSTQWDALSHLGYDDHFYNGMPSSQVTGKGASRNAIQSVAPLLVGRGVLIDIASLKGVQTLPRDYEISPEDLSAALERQGAEVRSGDFVLIRTGWTRTLHSDGPDSCIQAEIPGIGMPVCSWLVEHEIAAVASDTYMVEIQPSVVAGAVAPVHMISLRDVGMMLGEMFDLEALAQDCAADGQWEFFLAAQCLKITGAVGSPLAPVAIK